MKNHLQYPHRHTFDSVAWIESIGKSIEIVRRPADTLLDVVFGFDDDFAITYELPMNFGCLFCKLVIGRECRVHLVLGVEPIPHAPE